LEKEAKSHTPHGTITLTLIGHNPRWKALWRRGQPARRGNLKRRIKLYGSGYRKWRQIGRFTRGIR